jgi:hypothetical protein
VVAVLAIPKSLARLAQAYLADHTFMRCGRATAGGTLVMDDTTSEYRKEHLNDHLNDHH